MKFMANCNVFYRNVFHRVGEIFDIEDTDAGAMKDYGTTSEEAKTTRRKK